MVKTISMVLLLAVVVTAAVVAYNTWRFRPYIPAGGAVAASINGYDSAALRLGAAIRIKTVSFGDTLPIDTPAFVQFKQFLETSYPLVHSQLPRLIFSEFSYLYKWTGTDSSLAPVVLMAHMDVVPVEAVAESKWTVPSFSGAILRDTIWGRGAVDNKSAVIAILEAVEQLLAEKYQPKQTIYLCFGHDEEVAGKRGAKKMAAWFVEQQIKPALVLDEGGQITTTQFPELKRPVALVGVGEKGYMNVDMTVEIPGGHSSMPAKETAIDVLNQAITKLRSQQMPPVVSPPVQEMLRRTYGSNGVTGRMVMGNMWLFQGLVLNQMDQNKAASALVHTTLVPTIVKAGIKDNVIPSVAKATFNSRIVTGQTSDEVMQFAENMIADERVLLQKQTISLMEPSPVTHHEHPMFHELEEAVHQSAGEVLVSPYLLIMATDSRYFRPFSGAVLNFAPIHDAKGYHGIDERIGISDLKRMIHFYRNIITRK